MENLKNLIKIKSYQNCDEILEYLKNNLGNKVEELSIFGDTAKILLAGINTKLKCICPIVLSGHIDTVSANVELYNTNPFELTKIDGKAYGIGTIDMKSFIAIILDNIELIKKLETPVILALTKDEETNLKSIELMIEKFKQLDIKPKFTIIGEPTNSQFCITSNACYEYSAKFFGKSCHSSKLYQGTNAICACAKFINHIENFQKKYRLTSNCGFIYGGEVVNKVPDYTELSFDIRSIYQNNIQMFLNDIQNFKNKLIYDYDDLKIEITKKLSIPALNMLNNKKILKIAKDLNIKTNTFSSGCEAGYYTNYFGDAVIFGVGDLSLAHMPNEYVQIDEYYSYSNKLLLLLNVLKQYY